MGDTLAFPSALEPWFAAAAEALDTLSMRRLPRRWRRAPRYGMAVHEPTIAGGVA